MMAKCIVIFPVYFPLFSPLIPGIPGIEQIGLAAADTPSINLMCATFVIIFSRLGISYEHFYFSGGQSPFIRAEFFCAY